MTDFRMRAGVCYGRRLAAAAALLLAACGGGGGSGSAPGGGSPPPANNSGVSGKAFGGEQPISGAAVTLYAVGSTGYGRGATALGNATTAGDGTWSISFNCPAPGTLVYVTALGGNGGAGVNPAIGLAAMLGPCGQGTLPSFVDISELSTIATVAALSQFLDSSGQVIGAPASNSLGLGNAANNVAALVTPASAPAGVTVPSATINTLANLLGTCVSSAGGTSGDASPCGQLFTAATPADGSAPTTTLAAAWSIARNPASGVAELYALAPANGPYQPGLTAAPGDWIIALTLSGGGLDEPTSVAIDAEGRAWVADYQSAVSAFAPDGAALSPAAGYTGGGLEESFGIAVDGGGNVWVTNKESPSGVNSALGSITELSSTGAILSGANGYTGGGIYFPLAVAIDGSGNAWIADYAHSAITELAPGGTALSPAGGYTGGGVEFPSSVAIDGDGQVWIVDEGSSHVSQLSATGAPLSASPGFSGGGLNVPSGLCLDTQGNAWVMNYDNNTATELQGAAGAAPGSALSPPAGYAGGGLAQPNGCAADGSGNIWIANFHGTSLSLLSGPAGASPGAALSPSTGLVQGLTQPYGLAVDASGNIWIVNFQGDKGAKQALGTVTLALGAATPVKTPLIGLPRLP